MAACVPGTRHSSTAKQPSVHFDLLRQIEEHDTATLCSDALCSYLCASRTAGHPRIELLPSWAPLQTRRMPRRSTLIKQQSMPNSSAKQSSSRRETSLDASDHNLSPRSNVRVKKASITVCQRLHWFMFMFVVACSTKCLPRDHDCLSGIEPFVFRGVPIRRPFTPDMQK